MLTTLAVLATLVQGGTTQIQLSDPLFEGVTRATVRVDSSHRIVRVTTQSSDVGPTQGGYGEMHHAGAGPEAFAWPVDGWIHGIRLRLTGADGKPLPRRLLHHLALVNFARGQLLKPTPERVVAFGQETDDMHLPATVGIPVRAGMPMVVALAWFNTSAVTYPGAHAELEIEWTPSSMMPRPVDFYPVSMDAVNAVSTSSGYDLPPGESEQEVRFTMPLSGKILAAGGHLHDFGRDIALREVTPGKERTLLQLASIRDASGMVRGMERAAPGITGSGIGMTAGREYQLVARNLNPTGELLHQQAMAYLVLLFSPAKGATWPSADPTSPRWKEELDYLLGAMVM